MLFLGLNMELLLDWQQLLLSGSTIGSWSSLCHVDRRLALCDKDRTGYRSRYTGASPNFHIFCSKSDIFDFKVVRAVFMAVTAVSWVWTAASLVLQMLMFWEPLSWSCLHAAKARVQFFLKFAYKVLVGARLHFFIALLS